MLAELRKLKAEIAHSSRDALNRLNNPQLYEYLDAQAIGVFKAITLVEEQLKKVSELSHRIDPKPDMNDLSPHHSYNVGYADAIRDTLKVLQ